MHPLHCCTTGGGGEGGPFEVPLEMSGGKGIVESGGGVVSKTVPNEGEKWIESEFEIFL